MGNLYDFYATEAAISKDAIVDLSAKADADTFAGKLVAVEGAAVDDNGKLIVPEAIKLASLEIAKNGLNTAYCPSVGMPQLGDLILAEALGKTGLEGLTQLGVHYASLICSGGTNALSVPMTACVAKQDPIIVQNPHWSGYDSIATAIGHDSLINFDFVNSRGDFNLLGLQQSIESILSQSSTINRLAILLNTPYDNPLAKAVSDLEWTELIKYLKALDRNKIKELVLILDLAYMDFGPGGKNYNRLNFLQELFRSLDDNISVVLAITLSKSFAMYGARIASSVLLSKNIIRVQRWKDIAGGIIRGTYSSASRLGQELAMNILQDPSKLQNIHEYQSTTVKLIQERQDHLFVLLKNYDLFSDINSDQKTLFQYIKPDGVFFTSMKISSLSQARALYELMLENHLYIPIISDQYMRLPICGMRKDFIDRVIQKLVELANKI